MSYAHEKLTDEDDRAKKYLDFSQPASYNRLLQASVHILVVQFQEQILNEATNLIAENETRRKGFFEYSTNFKHFRFAHVV